VETGKEVLCAGQIRGWLRVGYKTGSALIGLKDVRRDLEEGGKGQGREREWKGQLQR